MKRYYKWWLIAALAVVAIQLLTCCAGRVKLNSTRIPIWSQAFVEGDETLAHTSCDLLGNPIILVNAVLYKQDSLPPRWAWRYILAHEYIHVSQMRKHSGGCNGALAQYVNDPKYRMQMELEATCVELTMLAEDGRLSDPEQSFAMAVGKLYIRYGIVAGLTPQQFKAAMPCGIVPTKPNGTSARSP